MRWLRRFADQRSLVLLDDYAERTFLFADHRHYEIVHTRPWIAIFHHPPDMREWYSDQRLQDLDQNTRWHSSLPELRLVIALSNATAEWIANRWNKPAVVIKHPTVFPRRRWSSQRFALNPRKLLIQVGSFLRNPFAIHQVAAPKFLSKARLRQTGRWVTETEDACRRHLSFREGIDHVHEIPSVDNRTYDIILSENVIFLEAIAAAATNTVLECIARDTPIVLNRREGLEFYLGARYPLFYDDLSQVRRLVTHETILAAHRYLRQMDKTWLGGQRFARSVAGAITATGDLRKQGDG